MGGNFSVSYYYHWFSYYVYLLIAGGEVGVEGSALA